MPRLLRHLVNPTSPATSRGRIVLATIAGVVAMLLYAGQFVVSRWSIQRTLSLWDLAALRFTVAGLLMLPVVMRRGLLHAAGIGWSRSAILAVAAGAPYTLVMYAGLVMAPAAHGAVIIPGVTPVVSTMLVWSWLGERPWPAKLGGLALIVVGLVLVGWPGMVDGGNGRAWIGDLLFVAAGVLWALFTVLTRRWHIDPLRGTAMVWVLGLAYVPVYAIFAGARLVDAPRGEVLFQALYQGVGVAVVALALYAWAIRVLGASFASLFMPLIPVFGVWFGIPVLHEVPTPVQLFGMLAVSIGMALAAARHYPRGRQSS
jgi:drug/metabolite transporter (DMT)-like permease